MRRSSVVLSEEMQTLLACPICRASLGRTAERLVCTNEQCGMLFPIINGIPVLINEANSLFSIADFEQRKNTTHPHVSPLRRLVARYLPQIGSNLKARKNYAGFASLLLRHTDWPRVLVIGGSEAGLGMQSILSVPSIKFIDSDVSFGARTQLICDGHDLPFLDGTLDGVIIQAVLEHVLDPYRIVEEIHRVLKDKGLVYAETPFMQQVHGGKYDFTRFTYLGHRRLFRNFDEISSGAMCGPGMALAWSIMYFLLSFTQTAQARAAVTLVSRLTLFWLKYFDYFLIDKPGTLDSASGYYFMGRKSRTILPDRDLIELYKGIM